MKKLACSIILCGLMGWNNIHAAPDSPTDSGFQLTIELRDGSRVVGKTVDDAVNLHSGALGDLKLSWAGIRAIEFAADTDTARLTATNGDGFSVQFAAETLSLETGFGKTELPVKQIRSIKVSPTAKANVAAAIAAGEAGFQLTIDLRDGSHVVGKGLDDTLNFHSPAMGDLKLGWAGIRSLEYAGTDTARLTATNGDVYEVQLAADTLRVETSFGKTDLPVKLIRSLKVSAMTTPGQLPAGLVALWSGEGNANDSIGGNNGQLLNGAGFAPGKIGQAFAFHNLGDQVIAPATDLPTGTSDRTIDCWIYIESFSPDLLGFVVGYGTMGEGRIYSLAVKSDRRIAFTQWGDELDGPALETGRWYNVAVTSVGTGSIKLYLDGVNVATAAMNFNTPTGVQFRIANYNTPGVERQFYGLIDEVAVYNRALSDSEIQTIYMEQK